MLRNLIQEIMKIFHFIWLELYRANVRWSLPTYHDASLSIDFTLLKPKFEFLT